MGSELLGFNTWTKNSPQQYLKLYADVAQKMELPLVAIVDDVLPAVVFNRSDEENAKYNQAYKNSMLEMGFCKVEFVSSILPDRCDDLTQLYAISNRVNLAAFLSLLPESKRTDTESLSLGEAVDTCWQICVLEAGMSTVGITRYLTGKRSTALFRYAKKIIRDFDYDIIEELL